MADTKELVTPSHTIHSPLALNYSMLTATSNYSVSLISFLGGQHVCMHMHTHKTPNSLRGRVSYQANVKLSSFLDQFLYFDLKQMFHTISIIKYANVYYQGNL
jgi:hypothetical protein